MMNKCFSLKLATFQMTQEQVEQDRSIGKVVGNPVFDSWPLQTHHLAAIILTYEKAV
jgi:hypothetical protein